MSSSCRHSGFVVYRTKVTPNWLLKVQRARRARQHQRRTQTEATVNRTLLEEANSCPTEPCPRIGLVVSLRDHTLHGTPRDVHTTEESESNKMSKFTTRSIPRGTISRTHDSSISERSPQDSPIRCPNRRRCHRARQRPRHTRSRTHPPTSSKSYNRLRSILPSTKEDGHSGAGLTSKAPAYTFDHSSSQHNSRRQGQIRPASTLATSDPGPRVMADMPYSLPSSQHVSSSHTPSAHTISSPPGTGTDPSWHLVPAPAYTYESHVTSGSTGFSTKEG